MGSTPRGISGSRAAAILGLGEYEGQTPFTVWQQIMEERRPGFAAERGMALPPPVDNAAVRWGSAFEDAIVELAEAKRGKEIDLREKLFAYVERADGEHVPVYAEGLDFDPSYPWPMITCHIDGAYYPGIQNALHEGKTTSLFAYWDNWGTPGTDRIPQGYQIQVQHQMLCTGASECVVSVLVFPRRVDEWENGSVFVDKKQTWWICRKDPDEIVRVLCAPQAWARVIAEMGLFHQYPVSASPTLQRTLVDAYRHFWHTYVLPEREPEIDAYADIRRAFPAPKGTLVATEQEERWTAEYRQIGEEIGASGRLAKRREELKVLLLKSMRARDGAMDDESREATILRDSRGKKLASWNGKVFRS